MGDDVAHIKMGRERERCSTFGAQNKEENDEGKKNEMIREHRWNKHTENINSKSLSFV